MARHRRSYREVASPIGVGMRDLVLVDAQPARVRLFRQALAVYRERLTRLRQRSHEGTERARDQLERAERLGRAIQGTLGLPKLSFRGQIGPDQEVRLHVFPSREEALKFLRQEPPYEWAPRPAVVFTDLYLEEANRGVGGSVVGELKADAALCAIPAVTLCSGATSGQIREAWDAGSNAVVDLSGEMPAMLAQVADTLEFWLQEAAL